MIIFMGMAIRYLSLFLGVSTLLISAKSDTETLWVFMQQLGYWVQRKFQTRYNRSSNMRARRVGFSSHPD